MSENNFVKGPERCSNCGSNRITGPYTDNKGRIFFGLFTSVGQEIYICSDCFYTMYFVNRKDVEKAQREIEKHQHLYE